MIGLFNVKCNTGRIIFFIFLLLFFFFWVKCNAERMVFFFVCSPLPLTSCYCMLLVDSYHEFVLKLLKFNIMSSDDFQFIRAPHSFKAVLS